MIQIHKQIHLAVIPKSQGDIRKQLQTITMDKQTQQQIQQPITALQMGQMYQSIQLTPHHFLQCLKTYVALVLAGVFLPWALAYLVASMSGI